MLKIIIQRIFLNLNKQVIKAYVSKRTAKIKLLWQLAACTEFKYSKICEYKKKTIKQF